ncbi:Rop guanine nucleotide exchange factor 14-like protein [Tanacetum coccineum]
MDFDQPPDRIMTYNGLESCIQNANSYEDESSSTSKGDGGPTDSQDEDISSCCSSNNPSSSFFSQWSMMKRDEHGLDEWEYSESPKKFTPNENPSYTIHYSDVEVMKEKFAKLLLGEDTTGGRNGVSAALALSNAITNLAGEKEQVGKRDGLVLSPTNYMVQLIPAKQCGADGRTLEASSYNGPPKSSCDSSEPPSSAKETLDSMTETEFWYEEGGSRAEGRSSNLKQSKRWWLPMPQVPIGGLSDNERKKLLNQARLSGKASLGEDQYRIVNRPLLTLLFCRSPDLKVRKPCALDAINRLETAIHAWKKKIEQHDNGQSPARTSWSFKDPDVAHAIIEAYSRVLGNLAFSILTRIGDVSQEDILSDPDSPMATNSLLRANIPGISGISSSNTKTKHTLIDKMDNIEGKSSLLKTEEASHTGLLSDEPSIRSATTTPSRSSGCCLGKEAYFSTPTDSP